MIVYILSKNRTFGTVALAISQWRDEMYGTPITLVLHPIEIEGRRPYCEAEKVIPPEEWGFGDFDGKASNDLLPAGSFDLMPEEIWKLAAYELLGRRREECLHEYFKDKIEALRPEAMKV